MATIYSAGPEIIGDGDKESRNRISLLQSSFANSISAIALEAIMPPIDMRNIIRVLMSVQMGSRDLEEFEIRVGTPDANDEIVSGYYDIMQTGFLVEKEPILFTGLKAGELGSIQLTTPASYYLQAWAQTKLNPGEITLNVNGFYAR